MSHDSLTSEKQLKKKSKKKLEKGFDFEAFYKFNADRKKETERLGVYPDCKCVGACKGPIFGSRCKKCEMW